MPSGLIVVTGGSRGIGAAICRRLAADGYAVAVNYAADAKAAEATVAEIKKSGGRAQALQADVADAAQLHRLFDEATQALGPLAGLVNNAGVSGRFARVEERDADELTRLFAINTIGTILACKEAVLRLSTKRGGSGGSIVNISSIAARSGGLPGLAAYAATKGAVESLTKGLATEVGPEGIRVNAVAPGFTETDMNREQLAQASFRERM
jgi:NAD(P)-dependent dehydrogenase (short-subunit alcohol dehydrogenase family)